MGKPALDYLLNERGLTNKTINEWSADSLGGKVNPMVETVELKGVPMERKNIVYQNDLDESVNKLVDSLAKEGVLR